METRVFHKAWYGLGALGLTLALGCQGTAPQQTSAGDVPQAAALERTSETTVAITPTGERSVAATTTRVWATGDRLRTGSGTSLGYGFHRGGLLPYTGYRSGLSGLYLADLGAGTIYQVPAVPRDARYPVLSGGGRFVVYERNGKLERLDLATQLIQTFPQLDTYWRGPVGGLRDFDVDAFGNIAYVGNLGYINLFDPRTGENFRVAGSRGILNVGDRNRAYDIGNLSISGDGRYITHTGVTASGRSEVYVTDVLAGRQFTMPFVGGKRGSILRTFEVSPTGDQLLFEENGRVRSLDLRTGFIDNLPLLNSGSGPIWGAQYADASGSIVLFERDGRIMAYDRVSGLVDTMPIANRAADLGVLRHWGRFRFGRL